MADRRYTINAFTVKLEVSPSGDPVDAIGSTTRVDIERSIAEFLTFFESFDVRATFFTSNEVTRLIPGSVRAIRDAGHELAILSPRFYSPLDQLLHFREEVSTAKARLEDLTGQEVVGCRCTPITAGWRSPAMIETLVQEGFLYSSSTYPKQSLAPLMFSKTGKAHRLATPSGTLWEFPLTSWRPLGIGIPTIRTGGGTLLSALPTWMVARGVEVMNRHGEAAILYVHSWALDRSTPDYSSLPLRERLLCYGPHQDTLQRLEMIFRIYRFGSIMEAFASRLSSESGLSRPRRTSLVPAHIAPPAPEN